MLVLSLAALPAGADDQIIKKDGTSISGQINGVSNGQVIVTSRASNGSTVKLSYYITDIQSVLMQPPADLAKARGGTPDVSIPILEPLVKQFAGLPSDWVADAMVQLADAYDATGKSVQAGAIYDQINQLYPGRGYTNLAVAGKAKMSLQQGKIDEALAMLQPVIDKANQNLAPSPADGRLYANIFLVYGQALEKQKKLPQALEAYLTVKTMFYQNPTLVESAEQSIKTLRDQNPGLGVE